MSSNKLADSLRSGNVAIGVANMYPAPAIIEGIAKGWDFVWIDGQHGEMTYKDVMYAVRVAAGMGIETVVRVPSDEPGLLGMYADMAPSSIMIPMVNTAAQAKRIVQALRFPPLGSRSYGGRRIGDLYGRDYYKDRELFVMAQIETTEGAANAREIIATEGIDCLFFGATDFKLSMGVPITQPEVSDKQLRPIMEGVAQAARAAGKIAGCVTYDPDTFDAARQMGYTLCAAGVDVLFLRVGAAERLKTFRARMEKK